MFRLRLNLHLPKSIHMRSVIHIFLKSIPVFWLSAENKVEKNGNKNQFL